MRSFLLCTVFIATVFIAPLFVEADTLFFSPSTGTYSSGKTFSVKVYVSSVSQAVNAVSGTLTFPPDKVQVVSVSKAGSILTLWVEDPTFSNSSGTIKFEGVLPNPGFTGSSGNIITVNFKAVGQGSAPLKFTTGSVLANDGKGTNILKNIGSASFTIGAAAAPTPLPAENVIQVDSNAPKAPTISSDVFTDGKTWYAKNDGSFKWNVGSDITGSRVLLNKIPKSEPTTASLAIEESKEVADLADGAWYLHVSLKNKDGWGPAGHYLFKIDTTKPESFIIKEIARPDQTDPKPRFSFVATDETSGINHYTVQIDNGDSVKWHDDGSGVYQTAAVGPGKHTLVARAYDEAGNYTVASADFFIGPIEALIITSYTKEVTPAKPFAIAGTSIPGTVVHVKLEKEGSKAIAFDVRSDDNGNFEDIYDKGMANGTYILTAVAEDKRGAQSIPTEELKVMVKESAFFTLGAGLIRILGIVIPAIALVFLLIFILLWGKKKVRRMRQVLSADIDDVENTVDQAFTGLKKDLEDSVRILEEAKQDRKLTYEEIKVVSKLKESLAVMEDKIMKKLRKAEKDVKD